jgi:carboxyl-terminal processing protease
VAAATAAAVQGRKRGRSIGQMKNRSVVSGQMFDLPEGGKMMIPTQDFMRPDGRRIENAGVQPDFWILPTLEDVRAGRDPALDQAMLALR